MQQQRTKGCVATPYRATTRPQGSIESAGQTLVSQLICFLRSEEMRLAVEGLTLASFEVFLVRIANLPVTSTQH